MEGKWKITNNQIGCGSYARVFLGYCGKKRVAVKRVLVDEDTSIEAARRALENDYYALRQLSHANVVKAYVNTNIPMFYFFLEWAPMGSLDHWLERHVVNWEQQGYDWVASILKAIDYIHSQKCIHNDLHSGNVLLFSNQLAKLSDFGSAMFNPKNDQFEFVFYELKRFSFILFEMLQPNSNNSSLEQSRSFYPGGPRFFNTAPVKVIEFACQFTSHPKSALNQMEVIINHFDVIRASPAT